MNPCRRMAACLAVLLLAAGAMASGLSAGPGSVAGGLPTGLAGGLPNGLTDEVPDRDPSRIQQAIALLLQTPKGKTLISEALKNWKLNLPDELLRVVRPSSVSRTDAVLTRHYNSDTGVETRERDVTIYLRQDQSIQSMALDLAHELVHATSRPAWDPYDPNLTPGIYIKNSIEGPGGEVQAVQAECQVAFELAKNPATALHHCGAYLSATAGVGEGHATLPDAQKITADFYRVGEWRPYLDQALGPEARLFPLLSDQPPRLYSSTGNAPYPASLYREFRILTQIACENSKRRASLSQSRSIASAPTFRFLERRCR